MLENIVVVVLLAAIVAGIVFYLYRAKKQGATCIGCPHAKQCAKNGGGCNCQNHSNEHR